MANQLIILNGPSSAGKSSIAKELQSSFKEVYLHFQIDAFLAMAPDHIEEKAPIYKKILPSFIQSIKTFADDNNNIIADLVLTPKSIQKAAEVLKPLNPQFIAVTASLDTLKKREKDRGNREIGLSESQYTHIPKGIEYDFKIDTTELTAKEAAKKIIEYLSKASKPQIT